MEDRTGHRGTDEPRLRARFVLEQHLGHQTYAENLRAYIGPVLGIEAHWTDVTYEGRAHWWEALIPFQAAKGALRGRQEVLQATGRPADVTFFNTQVPAVIGGRRARRRPYVICTDITPRQYDRMGEAYGHRADGGGPLAALKHHLNTRVFQGAARCVGWSTWVADSLAGEYGVERERIDVIPPGVDVERWCPLTRVRRGPVRILFVGGDFERKGGPALLGAFRSLPAGSAELVIVTRSRVPAEESVTVLHDLQPNSAALVETFRSSDVFALPTSAEALGIAAVEASACGLPVIASRVGGLSDVVQHGVTGYLVPADDIPALSSQLRRLVLDTTLRDRMGSAARQHSVKHFHAVRNAERVAGLLQAVARQQRTGAPAYSFPGRSEDSVSAATGQ